MTANCVPDFLLRFLPVCKYCLELEPFRNEKMRPSIWHRHMLMTFYSKLNYSGVICQVGLIRYKINLGSQISKPVFKSYPTGSQYTDSSICIANGKNNKQTIFPLYQGLLDDAPLPISSWPRWLQATMSAYSSLHSKRTYNGHLPE